jgi:hypothetical protein
MPGDARSEKIAHAIANFDSFCGLLQIRLKAASGSIADAKRIQMAFTPLQMAYNRVRSSRDIVLKPRQVYFTTLEAARDVWWFITKPGAHVVVVCQSQSDQAAQKDIAEKFRIFFDSLHRLGLKLEFGRESGNEWSLPKRDATLRIIQAGASDVAAKRKGRGGTVNRLHLSEMAFWGAYAQSTFLSLTESVPKDGSEIVNESTANGAGGFYFDQWKAAVEKKSVYQPHFVAWYAHTEYRVPLDQGEVVVPQNAAEQGLLAKGVTPEQIKWLRWKISEKGGKVDLVAQEYPNDPETCFLVEGHAFFDLVLVNDLIALAKAPQVLDSYLNVWHEPKPDSQYVIGADTSGGGADADAQAAIVLERGTCKHVASLHGHEIPWDYAKRLAALGAFYNNATIAVERENHGSAVLSALDREYKYTNLYSQPHDDGGRRDGKLGWSTNVASRAPMLDAIDAAMRRGMFKTDDIALLGEMRDFVVGKSGKAEASTGCHDDRVMAAAIAWAVATRPAGYAGDLPAPTPLNSPLSGW